MRNGIRYGYVEYSGYEHRVAWHTISKKVYVHCRRWIYAGKAYEMQDALDVALSYLREDG